MAISVLFWVLGSLTRVGISLIRYASALVHLQHPQHICVLHAHHQAQPRVAPSRSLQGCFVNW